MQASRAQLWLLECMALLKLGTYSVRVRRQLDHVGSADALYRRANLIL
jgi:hypothetical protein